MPREEENTQHIASKIAPSLLNGDFKLFSDYVSSLITCFTWFIWFWKHPAQVGEQLCDANVFNVVAPVTTPAPHRAPDHLYPLHPPQE